MATTWWVKVDMTQSRPFDLGLDGNSRPMCAFNISVTKRPSETFEEEVAAVLAGAGVGVLNTDLFVSSAATLPKDGTVLSLGAPGAAPPINTHDAPGVAYEQATMQLVARGATYTAARALAWAAFNALSTVRNRAVTTA